MPPADAPPALSGRIPSQALAAFSPTRRRSDTPQPLRRSAPSFKLGLPAKVYDDAGYLTVDAIRALVRRVWWSSANEETGIESDRSDPMAWQKSIRLDLWYGPTYWPPWWETGRWHAVGDGLEAFVEGTLLECWLTVRRRPVARRHLSG